MFRNWQNALSKTNFNHAPFFNIFYDKLEYIFFSQCFSSISLCKFQMSLHQQQWSMQGIQYNFDPSKRKLVECWKVSSGFTVIQHNKKKSPSWHIDQFITSLGKFLRDSRNICTIKSFPVIYVTGSWVLWCFLRRFNFAKLNCFVF